MNKTAAGITQEDKYRSCSDGQLSQSGLCLQENLLNIQKTVKVTFKIV